MNNVYTCRAWRIQLELLANFACISLCAKLGNHTQTTANPPVRNLQSHAASSRRGLLEIKARVLSKRLLTSEVY